MLSDRVIENRYDSPQNNTDYVFPRWWGLLLERANDPDDPITRNEVYETRSEWFLEQRVKDQMERQREAGMWDQWSEERLDEVGMTFSEAIAEIENNDYKIK